MGLLETLSQIKKEGFDPKTDKVAKSTKLEAGTYPVRLKSAEANVSKSGQTQLAITLEVVSGEDKNRLEVIYMSFDDALPEFVKEKNGRTLLKLGTMAGVGFTNGDLVDEYATTTALEKVIGSQFLMNLTVSPNKKNPDFPYRNYDFGPLDDSSDGSDAIDIPDEDLPF
ncbi:DUF669 domain-containing protein [Enterococcus sp. BWR-S5]|uniref:DUF669 domain-containing protein n=1 Tax=Enterococcus sp. BWR-S5 TaxID=2787714 RepID=UPI00192333CA|nr:DUF669 domain-containing protein [Enterococcus sp. BWR-S5]MBL1225399.1 DUF669 domain-containing protein [Enterococcus sp. BWR-S5]